MIMFSIVEGTGMHVNENEVFVEKSNRRDDLFLQTLPHLYP